MADQEPEVRAVFCDALKYPASAAQMEYLDRACAGKPGLRARVEALIEAHYKAGSFFQAERPVDPTAGTSQVSYSKSIAEQPGSSIGRYQLVRELGCGGMGVVFTAEQQEPVHRKVALKIIKPGMDTREVVARFEAESQALALMDHPCIAHVLDGGSTPSGRPYFVMELVEGIPITDYCDEHRYDTRQRLELFIRICQAVQHAHQKGVIHRDIKPSNILVTNTDDGAVPKVIDFGIAKAVHQQLSDQSVHTHLSQVVGTPLYMSPEQAKYSGRDVDTRTDVYALGVLLYELLTGTTPFDRAGLQDLEPDKVLRVICEEEPPRPSVRLSTMGATIDTADAHNHVDRRKLSRELAGELDWIVMKALEKDRARRYESAHGLARDVQRYLDDESVEACPPSTLYRLRKFTRRNRVVVLTASAIALALILGAGVATGQAYRATKAERFANKQLEIVKEQRRLVKKQKQLAEDAAKRERDLRTEAEGARKEAERVTEFLVEIFRSPDPERDGRTITVAEMLDKAQLRVETELKDDLLLQAKLLQAIGETYSALGLVKEAAELFQKSHDIFCECHGSRHSDTLTSTQKLAAAYRAAGQFDKALALAEHALQIGVELRGRDHPETLTAIKTLADVCQSLGQLDRAVTLHEQTLELREQTLGLEHPETLTSMNNLANNYYDDGRFNDALALREKVFALSEKVRGPTHPDTLVTRLNLAISYCRAGQLEKSLKQSKELVGLMKKHFGPQHPLTMHAMNLLAGVHRELGQLDAGLPLLEEVLKTATDKLGSNHPTTLLYTDNLAATYWSLGELDKSIPLYEEALERSKLVLGDDHPRTLAIISNLGMNYLSSGRNEQAARLLEEGLSTCRERLNATHPARLRCIHNLAGAYVSLRRFNEAAQLFEEKIELQKETMGPAHVDTLMSMRGLAKVYHYAGWTDQALPLLQETLERCRQNLNADHPQTRRTMRSLAKAYHQAEQFDEAIAVCNKLLEREPGNAELVFELGTSHLAKGDLPQAVVVYSKCMALPDDPKPKWLRSHAIRRRGEVYMLLGEDNKALRDFEKALDLDPDDCWNCGYFGLFLAMCFDPSYRDPGRAVELAQKAVELNPDRSELWRCLGSAQYRQGDLVAALASLKKAEDLGQYGSFVLAMVHHDRGDTDQARKHFELGDKRLNDDTKGWYANLGSRLREEAAELLGITKTSEEEEKFDCEHD